MIRYFCFIICVFSAASLNAQSFNQERIALENFLVRMYSNGPFEGVKLVSDYNKTYLLSVVIIKEGSAEATNNRIAQIKSQRQVSQYIGGLTTIDSETIIRTTEDSQNHLSCEEITDIIKEHSTGFTKGMEVLTTFKVKDNNQCYMFYRDIDELK